MTSFRDVGARQSTIAELQVELGAQVRAERIRQRVEQAELARRAGVARTAVSRLENGRGGTVSSLLAVVRALGRLDWLAALSPRVSVEPMNLISRSRRAPQRVRNLKSSKLA